MMALHACHSIEHLDAVGGEFRVVHIPDVSLGALKDTSIGFDGLKPIRISDHGVSSGEQGDIPLMDRDEIIVRRRLNAYKPLVQQLPP